VLTAHITSWSKMFGNSLSQCTSLRNWYRYNVCRTHLEGLLDELKRDRDDASSGVCHKCCTDCLRTARKQAALQAEKNFALGSDIARFLGAATFSDTDDDSSEDVTPPAPTAEFISASIKAHENPGASNDEAMCLAHRWESLMGQQEGPPALPPRGCSDDAGRRHHRPDCSTSSSGSAPPEARLPAAGEPE
jgi:hypothetical protein